MKKNHNQKNSENKVSGRKNVKFPALESIEWLPASSVQNDKIGLCFSGGGAKGAYEIGVWQALEELNLAKNVEAVSGTSVGALNAALFVNVSQKDAANLWKEKIGYLEVLTPDIKKWTFSAIGIARFAADIMKIYKSLEKNHAPNLPAVRTSVLDGFKTATHPSINILMGLEELGIQAFKDDVALQGIFSRDALRNIILETTNLENFTSSKIKTYAVAVRKKGFVKKTKSDKACYFLLNEQKNMQNICDILLASSAIPIAFDSQTIGADAIENGRPVGAKHQYYDGGFTYFGGRNTPVKPLLSDESIKTIIIVHLDCDEKFYGKYLIADRAYKDGYLEKLSKRKIIEIIPSLPLGNFFTGTLNFFSKNIDKLIELGYEDAKKVLSQCL